MNDKGITSGYDSGTNSVKDKCSNGMAWHKLRMWHDTYDDIAWHS